MIAEAHLMVGIFFSFQQGNLKIFFIRYLVENTEYTYIKETCPHHVAIVCSVEDEVIMDGSFGGAVCISRVPERGLLGNQPVLGE